jgi:hypothetical protein
VAQSNVLGKKLPASLIPHWQILLLMNQKPSKRSLSLLVFLCVSYHKWSMTFVLVNTADPEQPGVNCFVATELSFHVGQNAITNISGVIESVKMQFSRR